MKALSSVLEGVHLHFAVARAIIIGSKLKADVFLYSVNAAEVDHEWLDAITDISSGDTRLPAPDADWSDDVDRNREISQ